MSTAKHTAGPWHVGVAPHGDCRIYSGSESHAIARTYWPELNGIGVCDLTGPMNRADARLIAAAPDLLASLKSVLDMVASGTPNLKVVIAARAVIARATDSSHVQGVINK